MPLAALQSPKLDWSRGWKSIIFLETCREEAMKKLTVLCTALTASALCATPISLHWSPKTTPSLAVDSADARVGRPLTPMSVAGVNRRMHRRAYRHNYYGNPYAFILS